MTCVTAAIHSLLAVCLEAGVAQSIEDRFARTIRQAAKLERDDNVLGDECGADAGAEAEEEHASAVVAAERLHRGVVDHTDWPAECSFEVEAHPAVAEVSRLGAWPVGVDCSWIANRDDVVVPVGGGFAHLLDEHVWREFLTGVEAAAIVSAADQHLDV